MCDNLYYLHHKHIADLEPTNILLDYKLMLKIADLGLLRCFDEKQSRMITSNLIVRTYVFCDSWPALFCDV
jgi:serine/threonine protein kinase